MCITKDQLVYFCLHYLTFEEDWQKVLVLEQNSRRLAESWHTYFCERNETGTL